MESSVPERLAGWEIHGFRTMEELEVAAILEEARTRWLRPNEIHAILCNYTYFNVFVKPVNLPKSGTIVLFDRKMLRNFRKDGYNWKKKKDGKTVKEAHEHLKVGDEERIHVYYAHGQDKPTFVRRCYWLLDKMLEHIVLVHYRETQELQGSPVTPVNSNSSSSFSDRSAHVTLSEENDSAANCGYYAGKEELLELEDSVTVKNHEMRLHEINTLEWEELVVPNDSIASKEEKFSYFDGHNLCEVNESGVNAMEVQKNSNLLEKNFVQADAVSSLGTPAKDGLQTQDSLGRWMNFILTDSPATVDDQFSASQFPAGHDYFVSSAVDHNPTTVPEFSITDISPSWAVSTESTKILVVGIFNDQCQHLGKSNLLCVCGDACVPVEIIQVGVFRCLVPPHAPGLVNVYLSFDGQNPISQVLTFEYRTPTNNQTFSSKDKSDWEEFQDQMRLAHLLFSTSKRLNNLSSKISPTALKEARNFALNTSNVANCWTHLIKSVEDGKISIPQVKNSLFELSLKNRLQEWLLERVIEGGKATDYDDQGRGVIHLCAILGYTWAINLFSLSGLSINYRDKNGWTALHWAAHFGRKKMVAVLLLAGAKPNLVTDPTSENPGGCTAADLASKNGYDGLGAYLAEKSLIEQFKDMTIAGNVSGSLQISTTESVNFENLTEDELYLKDTLSAYRTAADAAARIQTAFRERSLKLRTEVVQTSNPEIEARNIIAAMKIQHAFRNYDSRKRMGAAARIQHRFRSWKIRKEFLNMRRQAIKIQAAFRGFQLRRQYCKIIWSVGVLEKAVLRWRLKRKGFRGLQVNPVEAVADQQQQECDAEEDFFVASRKQAEERVERAVVKVQAMFRSKKAQQEYHSIKMAHNQAQLECEGLLDPDLDLDR